MLLGEGQRRRSAASEWRYRLSGRSTSYRAGAQGSGLCAALEPQGTGITRRTSGPQGADCPVCDPALASTAAEAPVITVDTKKRGWAHNFKNAGRVRSRAATEVNMHDFPASRHVHPRYKHGSVAAPVASSWERGGGYIAYPQATALLLLAERIGIPCRPHYLKQQSQERLRDRPGPYGTIGHYPAGCPEWNRAEHRLFGPMSLRWVGIPPRPRDTLLNYTQVPHGAWHGLASTPGTTTATVLTMRAPLHEQVSRTAGVSPMPIRTPTIWDAMLSAPPQRLPCARATRPLPALHHQESGNPSFDRSEGLK